MLHSLQSLSSLLQETLLRESLLFPGDELHLLYTNSSAISSSPPFSTHLPGQHLSIIASHILNLFVFLSPY